tara:strand:- start:63 stop:278 length:216 start_codon:yes stop_codon:yes gene_type:complete
MSYINNDPDRWINFVLLNGWRLKAEVNEETGGLNILVSNEKGNVTYNYAGMPSVEQVEHSYLLEKNEKESS